MELAEENLKPFSCSNFFMDSLVKIAFTPFWASSKFPLTAATPTLQPSWVTIWSRWTSLTPSSGKNTIILVPGTSLNPSRAAFPVSPEVATSITISAFSPVLAAARGKNLGRACRAISLKALVGPCQSSSTYVPLYNSLTGAISGCSKDNGLYAPQTQSPISPGVKSVR